MMHNTLKSLFISAIVSHLNPYNILDNIADSTQCFIVIFNDEYALILLYGISNSYFGIREKYTINIHLLSILRIHSSKMLPKGV